MINRAWLPFCPTAIKILTVTSFARINSQKTIRLFDERSSPQ